MPILTRSSQPLQLGRFTRHNLFALPVHTHRTRWRADGAREGASERSRQL